MAPRGIATQQLRTPGRQTKQSNQLSLPNREEERHNNIETPGRQTKHSNQLSLPNQDIIKRKWIGPIDKNGTFYSA